MDKMQTLVHLNSQNTDGEATESRLNSTDHVSQVTPKKLTHTQNRNRENVRGLNP